MIRPDSRIKNGLFVLALVATTLLAYQPSWNGKPIWDDEIRLTTPEMRTLGGLERIWVHPKTTQQYHPLVDTVFWLEDKAWGNSMLGYHIVNILLHVLSALLFGALLRRFEVPGATLAAVLFALHPVHVESVAWLVELKNTLSGVFYFGAALAYSNFIRTRNLRPYVTALSLFAIGLLAKTIVATLPVAILILLWWKRGTIKWKQDVFPLLPFILIALLCGAATGWMEQRFSGAEGPEFVLPFMDRVLIAGHAFWFYLAKLFWPSDLILIYPRWTIDHNDWRPFLFILAPLALFGLAWSIRKRLPSSWAALLFFLVSLLPTLGFFNVYYFRFSYVADHFQYLPSAGIIAFIAAAIAVALTKVHGLSKSFFHALIAAVVTTLALLSWMHSRAFRDPVACYQSVLAKNPNCAVAHNNLGGVLFQEGQIDAALSHYDRAITIQPNGAVGYFNRGTALLEKANVSEAITDLQKALSLNPNYVKAYYSLGNALVNQGEIDLAIGNYQRALLLDPEYLEAHGNLGNALLQKGEIDAAIGQYEKAAAIDGANATVHFNLAVAYHQSKRLNQAIEQYRKTLAIRADYPEAEENLSAALKQRAEAREFQK